MLTTHPHVEVRPVTYPDRKAIVLRWRDPITGKMKTKTAGTADSSVASIRALQLEQMINEGRLGPTATMEWERFCAWYDREHLEAKSKSYQDTTWTAFKKYHGYMRPTMLTDITQQTVDEWWVAMAAEGRPQSTIQSYWRHLRAALRWARSKGLNISVPKYPGRDSRRTEDTSWEDASGHRVTYDSEREAKVLEYLVMKGGPAIIKCCSLDQLAEFHATASKKFGTQSAATKIFALLLGKKKLERRFGRTLPLNATG